MASPSFDTYPFSIELKDGKVVRHSIHLNSNPQQILECMAASIDFLPPPPPPPSSTTEFESLYSEKTGAAHSTSMFQHNGAGAINKHKVDHVIWSAGWGGNRSKVRHRTNSDNNLLYFLQNMDPNEIKERKLNRIGASAAALVARRAFQFSAIDGTGLGWSSASLKICLARLTSLFDEHHAKLSTKSFYPFRLILSSDEIHQKVDLYGGIIRLNPAATSMQWLDTLSAVTEESKQILKHNRDTLEQNVSLVEDSFGVRVVKGHSCESHEYHQCMERLALEQYTNTSRGNNESSLAVASNASLVIESDQACRRGKLRKDGNFEVGAGMKMHQIRATLSRFANRSNEYLAMESKLRDESNKIANQVEYEFGTQRVYKVTPIVSYVQMSECLANLLHRDEAEKDILRGFMVGQAFGITGRGQSCHLADDGSIVIPCNVA